MNLHPQNARRAGHAGETCPHASRDPLRHPSRFSYNLLRALLGRLGVSPCPDASEAALRASDHRVQHGVQGMKRGVAAAIMVLAWPGIVTVADDTLCARVKIEVQQELTLERQAFEARMRINNGLPDTALQEVGVTVTFADETGDPVVATSDPDNTEARFFMRVDHLAGVDDIAGAGTVEAGNSAEITWLIIPAPNASNGLEAGALYFVGATVRYTVAGKNDVIEVSPDFIFVKPLPELALDYFLPPEVYGDDAFTAEVEPPIPYSLGVRVRNGGSGVAQDLRIGSAQPRIVENDLGLLIGFAIEASTVNGQSATPSLSAAFGDLDPGKTATARWLMTCTLSGEFIDFDVDISHADALGGELTSLVQSADPHWLLHDVRVDLPGRDSTPDFLARDDDVIRLYESSGLDSDVTDRSAQAVLQTARHVQQRKTSASLSFPATTGPVLATLADPFAGQKVITGALRSDGKTLSLDNVWLSKSRKEDHSWEYFVNLFDVNTQGEYTLTFDDPSALPQPPVLAFIPNRSCFEGEVIAFVVTASDPNGTIPSLSADRLPAGATFEDRQDGTGIFEWSPAFGQAGEYRLAFSASDPDGKTTRTCLVKVYGEEVFTLTVGTTPPLELQFGFRAGAGDGYDPGVDVPADARDDESTPAWFACNDAEHPRLQADFRYASEMTRWRLHISVPDDRDQPSVDLAWNIGRADGRKTMLLQPLVDESPLGKPMDMNEQVGTVVPAVSVWEICYGHPVPAEVSLSKGWNLVGLPVMTTTPVKTVFADTRRDRIKLGPLWAWRGAYAPLEEEQPMNAERGYWVNGIRAGASPSVTGLEADGLTVLNTGWNLVSPVHDCTQPQQGGSPRAIWTWEPDRGAFRALFPAEIMRAGVGYWIYCGENSLPVSIGESPLER